MDVTVIVTAYNVEAFIDDAIESVVRAIHNDENIKVLIIDDGSDDGTWEKISKWKKASNTRIIRQQRIGLGAARNLGMGLAHSEYVMFLDGDDYLSDYWWVYIDKIVKHKKPDMIVFKWQSVYENGDFRDGPYALPTIDHMSIACWNKVYKTKVAKRFAFPEDVYFEDSGFSLLVWEAADAIEYLPNVLYSHRHRIGSISRKKLEFEHNMGVLKGLADALPFQAKIRVEIKNVAVEMIFSRLMNSLENHHTVTKNQMSELRNFYREYKLYIFHFDKGVKHFFKHLLMNACIEFKLHRIINVLFSTSIIYSEGRDDS